MAALNDTESPNEIKGFAPKVDYLMRHGRWAEVTETAEQFDAYQKLIEPLCWYAEEYDDMAEHVMVCQVHNEITEGDLVIDPHANCNKKNTPWIDFQRMIEAAVTGNTAVLKEFNLPDHRYRQD